MTYPITLLLCITLHIFLKCLWLQFTCVQYKVWSMDCDIFLRKWFTTPIKIHRAIVIVKGVLLMSFLFLFTAICWSSGYINSTTSGSWLNHIVILCTHRTYSVGSNYRKFSQNGFGLYMYHNHHHHHHIKPMTEQVDSRSAEIWTTTHRPELSDLRRTGEDYILYILNITI